MNHGLLEATERHPLWAVQNISISPWAIWSWAFPEVGSRATQTDCPVPPGTSWRTVLCSSQSCHFTAFTEANISSFGFKNSAVWCGGRGGEGQWEFLRRDRKLSVWANWYQLLTVLPRGGSSAFNCATKYDQHFWFAYHSSSV